MPSELNLIDDTQRFWQARANRSLMTEEARQVAENASGFFFLLQSWAEKRDAAAAGDHKVAQYEV